MTTFSSEAAVGAELFPRRWLAAVVMIAAAPLVNVVLAAAPTEAAGGASGVFSTAQQFGGAVGVAVVGTFFFARLEDETFTDAFTATLPIVVGLFIAAAVLALVLPRTAVAAETF